MIRGELPDFDRWFSAQVRPGPKRPRADVASRELRNNTRALLNRVRAGEAITITVDGRPVAVLQPVGHRPRWLARDELVRRLATRQADPGFAAELHALAPDTTDDLTQR